MQIRDEDTEGLMCPEFKKKNVSLKYDKVNNSPFKSLGMCSPWPQNHSLEQDGWHLLPLWCGQIKTQLSPGCAVLYVSHPGIISVYPLPYVKFSFKHSVIHRQVWLSFRSFILLCLPHSQPSTTMNTNTTQPSLKCLILHVCYKSFCLK